MPDLITLHLDDPALGGMPDEPDGPHTGAPGFVSETWVSPSQHASEQTTNDRQNRQNRYFLHGETIGEIETSHPSTHIHVHKARLQDARNIFDLVNSLSGDGTLLRRNYAEICENIRDFTVAECADGAGETEFLGCGALHLYGPHLAEVRSIVLRPERRGQGAGGALLRALLAESEDHGVTSTCLFTRIPAFFEHYGFRVAERTAMPDKIYKDCQTCPRLYACDEVAMVKGPLPQTAVLGPIRVQQPELVQVQILPSATGTFGRG